MTSNKPEQPTKAKPSINKYAQYSALAFQWIGLFIILSLGGNWLDKHWGFSFPILTLSGVFIALIFIFYSIFRLVNQLNKETQHDD